MERLKSIKETLLGQIQSQMGNLQQVNTKELGEVVDMVKDLDEAIYYCSIVKAMKENEEESRNYYNYYYSEPRYYSNGNGNGNGNGNNGRNGNGNTMYYEERPYRMNLRDRREGRSPASRRNYMETKETYHDKNKQIQELETYMRELSDDITEMITGASMEEKNLLKNKLNNLLVKIEQIPSQ